jgi:GEVED domain-containing protein/VCBS repeat protein
MSWVKRLARIFLDNAFSPYSDNRKSKAPRSRRVAVEPLEDRRLLSVGGTFDFGDLPDNYGTTLAADGARHEATGPTLGALRDGEADGLPTVGADGDGADEDGVTFGEIRVGQLDAQVTVNVQNASSGAKLDAWIDFNGDGSFGGVGERIAGSVEVSEGDNVVEFDVPSWAASGEAYARFRVSIGGDLGPSGAASDGEVEDYEFMILPTGPASGDFVPRTPIIENAWTTSVFSTDLDSDGDLDLLAASDRDHWLCWYENDGHETFTRHTIAASEGLVYAADVDGDGDMDVLSTVGRWFEKKATWYENDGNEHFTAHTITTTGNWGAYVFVGDLDGDGDTDLLSRNNSDSSRLEIAWYENDGYQTFTPHTITTGAWRLPVSVSDIDGDGDMDVLSTSDDRHRIVWHENNGTGGFATHTIATLSRHAGDVLIAADLDGDGDMDVLADADASRFWYENDGNESFTGHGVLFDSWEGAPVAADIDGDGDMDVLSRSSRGEVFHYENDASQNFVRNTIIDDMSIATGALSVADVDSDGDTDIVRAGLSDRGFVWYENDGDGHFTSRLIAPAAAGANSVFATDMDDDGDMDVVSASEFDDKIAWYENDGHRDFTAHTIATSANGACSVYAGDVDGDGDMDVLSASYDDDKIAWYENGGDEKFTTHVISSSADGVRSVFAADVDSDGDLDVLSASSRDDKIAWYENQDDGKFVTHVITTSADYAVCVFASDVDGDGDVDVLSASWRDEKIAWYENDGDENFTPHRIDRFPGGSALYATDLDRDGDMDFLLQAISHDETFWFENDGNGNFSRHRIAFSGATSLFPADVDGDSDIDLVAGDFTGPISWYENDGNQNFSMHTIRTTANQLKSVFAADMDNDGDLDVLSASSGDNRITWHEQLGTPPVAPDFGDAPDSYGTSYAANGARHLTAGPMLGLARDVEEDGVPTLGADGDDNTDQPDEYGVRVGLVMPGQVGAVVTVPVQDAPNGAKLDAWIDFDGNGTFDAGDQIADSVDVGEGENVIRFDVPDSAVAGQTYARFRLSTAGDLGPTGPANDGEVEDHLVTVYPQIAPVDLGVVDFVEFPRFDPSTDARVYTFTTKHAGYLTVLADEVVASGSLAVHLFDESGNLVGDTSTSTGDDTRVELLDLTAGKRYTVHVSGPESEVDLEIINLVEQVDGAVTVHGTDAADEFYYLAGSIHTVMLNGLRYDLDPAAIGSIHFAGGAGEDYVSMTGSAGDETAILRPDGGSMTTTATGFTVSAEDTERIAALGGGGNDMVELIDGEGDDIFYIWAHRALLRNATEYGGLSPMTADDFRSVHVYAKNGGNDTAKFQGTDDAERVKVYPEIVKMTRGEYFTRAKFFENVEVDTEGGTDTAIVAGSDGSDVVWASSYATRVAYDVDLAEGERPDLHYSAYGVSVVGCERTVARASGADDWVELHDSPVNDVLIAKPHRVDLMNGPRAEEGVARGAEYRITARGYGHVSAIADAGGDTQYGGDGDVAKLYDSGEEGVDIWAAGYVDGETWSTMTSPSRLLYEVLAFEHVGGYGFNGGLGEDHGINRTDHADDVDFVFQHGYWEGDEEPGPTNPRDPRGR